MATKEEVFESIVVILDWRQLRKIEKSKENRGY